MHQEGIRLLDTIFNIFVIYWSHGAITSALQVIIVILTLASPRVSVINNSFVYV